MPEPDYDERFSLHPDDPEEVLRKLLRQPGTESVDDVPDDDEDEPTQPS